LNKEVFEILKKELKYIALIFLLLVITFKIIYFKEDFFIVLRVAFSLFWLFLLPGYFIMLYWAEKLDFAERIIVGSGLSAAIIGISSYYTGLMGPGIKHHVILLPLLVMALGFAAAIAKKKG